MVTMIIAHELGLEDLYLAEGSKSLRWLRVESLFHYATRTAASSSSRRRALPAWFHARVCVVKPDELVPLPGDLALEKCAAIRRSAKERVFVTNALRALRGRSTGNIRDIPFVVLVGGSSLDFEVPRLVTDALAHYRFGRRARKYSRQQAQKRGGHRLILSGTGICIWTVIAAPRPSSLPLSTTAPASGTKCCWVKRRHPFLLQRHPAGDVVPDSAAGARSSPLLWLA